MRKYINDDDVIVEIGVYGGMFAKTNDLLESALAEDFKEYVEDYGYDYCIEYHAEWLNEGERDDFDSVEEAVNSYHWEQFMEFMADNYISARLFILD